MASHIVIFVQGDAKKSHRACEGIRVALGLAACDIKVELILSSGASVLLTDDLEECVDGEIAKQYLPSLIKFIPTIYIEREGVETPTAGGAPVLQDEYQIMFLSQDEIANKIALAECFAQF
ncbi:MAG: hypothetical protein HY201_01200 [Nitrospirae bacterium]|nr:hypothetical protein [Candidatus Troglogloeales bacterium]MBI3598066.1 hypothetical protein [Candidatus Troglogloeales bacterium]